MTDVYWGYKKKGKNTFKSFSGSFSSEYSQIDKEKTKGTLDYYVVKNLKRKKYN